MITNRKFQPPPDRPIPFRSCMGWWAGFFNTKPAMQVTGPGSSFSYDIVMAHGGASFVTSRETVKPEDGTVTSFIIQIPTKEN